MRKILFILLLFPFFLYSQTGITTPSGHSITTPGGLVITTTATWIPTDIAGCELWLDAGQGITKDGSDYVSAWADQSGNLNHATQGTGSNQPKWYDAQLNGLPTIYFDGGDKLILTSTIDLTTATVFWVYKKLAAGGNFPVLGENSGFEYSGLWDFVTSSYLIVWNNAAYKYCNGGGNTSYVTSELISDGTLANTHIYENGSLQTDGSSSGSPNYLRFEAVGYRKYFDNYATGYLAEIIIYDTALGAPDRTTVEAYLNTKYGLP